MEGPCNKTLFQGKTRKRLKQRSRLTLMQISIDKSVASITVHCFLLIAKQTESVQLSPGKVGDGISLNSTYFTFFHKQNIAHNILQL